MSVCVYVWLCVVGPAVPQSCSCVGRAWRSGVGRAGGGVMREEEGRGGTQRDEEEGVLRRIERITRTQSPGSVPGP